MLVTSTLRHIDIVYVWLQISVYLVLREAFRPKY